MPAFPPVISIVAGIFLGLGLLLLAATDLLSLALRYAPEIGSTPDFESLGTVEAAASWLLVAGGVIAMPALFQVCTASTAPSNRLRTHLSIVPGAIASVILFVAACAVLAQQLGVDRTTQVLSVRGSALLGDAALSTALLAMVVGSALAGGRAAGAAAAASAPVVLVATMAGMLELSIVQSIAAVLTPLLFILGALVAAAAIAGGGWRFAWVVGCAALVAFMTPLATGLLAPRETMSLVLVPAVVAGLVIHSQHGRGGLWPTIHVLVLETAALVLAFISQSLFSMAWALSGAAVAVRDAFPDDPYVVLALLVVVHFALAMALTPIIAAAAVVAMFPTMATAGFDPLFIVAAVTVSGLLGMVARTTAWRPLPSDTEPSARLSRSGGLIVLAVGALVLVAIIALPALVLDLPRQLY